MFKKRKFLISGVVLALAIAYLSYTGFVSSATYYYKVSEVNQKAAAIGTSVVRVAGLVTDGSVQQEGNRLQFKIEDEGGSLPVVYRGTVPDTFKAGNEVVVEGRFNASGVFEAKSILTKCASKYVPNT